MTDITVFNDRVAMVERLLQDKLSLRGRTLARRLKRAGRQLPKHARAAGQVILEAQKKAHHPKLARLNDTTAIDAAFADLTTYLNAIDPADRRRGAILGVLGGLVFNLLVLLTITLIFMRWQGMI